MRATKFSMSENIISNARLGVVGYCPPTRFDESIALNYIREAYDRAAIDFSKLLKLFIYSIASSEYKA